MEYRMSIFKDMMAFEQSYVPGGLHLRLPHLQEVHPSARKMAFMPAF